MFGNLMESRSVVKFLVILKNFRSMIILEDRSIFCRIDIVEAAIILSYIEVYTAAFSRCTDNMHFSPIIIHQPRVIKFEFALVDRSFLLEIAARCIQGTFQSISSQEKSEAVSQTEAARNVERFPLVPPFFLPCITSRRRFPRCRMPPLLNYLWRSTF